MWCKANQALRGIKARPDEDLLAGVEKAPDRVSANGVRGRFKSCGYGNIYGELLYFASGLMRSSTGTGRAGAEPHNQLPCLIIFYA